MHYSRSALSNLPVVVNEPFLPLKWNHGVPSTSVFKDAHKNITKSMGDIGLREVYWAIPTRMFHSGPQSSQLASIVNNNSILTPAWFLHHDISLSMTVSRLFLPYHRLRDRTSPTSKPRLQPSPSTPKSDHLISIDHQLSSNPHVQHEPHHIRRIHPRQSRLPQSLYAKKNSRAEPSERSGVGSAAEAFRRECGAAACLGDGAGSF